MADPTKPLAEWWLWKQGKALIYAGLSFLVVFLYLDPGWTSYVLKLQRRRGGPTEKLVIKILETLSMRQEEVPVGFQEEEKPNSFMSSSAFFNTTFHIWQTQFKSSSKKQIRISPTVCCKYFHSQPNKLPFPKKRKEKGDTKLRTNNTKVPKCATTVPLILWQLLKALERGHASSPPKKLQDWRE